MRLQISTHAAAGGIPNVKISLVDISVERFVAGAAEDAAGDMCG
jgi:hypothetical protein